MSAPYLEGEVVYVRDAMAGHFFGRLKEWNPSEGYLVLDKPFICQDFSGYEDFWKLMRGEWVATLNVRQSPDYLIVWAMTHMERYPHPLPSDKT